MTPPPSTVTIEQTHSTPPPSTVEIEQTLNTFTIIYNLTTGNEITELTKSLEKFQVIALVFSLFLLFIVCVVIGFICMRKCRVQNQNRDRIVTSNRNIIEHRNPTYCENTNPIYRPTTIPMSSVSEQISMTNIKPAMCTRPQISQPVLKSSTQDPTLQVRSVVNHNYRPSNLYEYEKEENEK